jgi:flagellar hook protein FlgE
MGISSSLFSGISGLSSQGNAMSVIGDNIANVNTIGFKASRTTFEDVLSQSVSTASGSSQIGRGAALSDVDLFQQGSFESTSNATDLAIGGNGFFMVSPQNSETNYYTRAGQFRFDADGFFVNPAG